MAEAEAKEKVEYPTGVPLKTMTDEQKLAYLTDIEAQIAKATTKDQLCEVFRAHFGSTGWKHLCRLAVLHFTPERSLSKGGDSS